MMETLNRRLIPLLSTVRDPLATCTCRVTSDGNCGPGYKVGGVFIRSDKGMMSELSG